MRKDGQWYNQWFKDTWGKNKFLFICVVGGFFSVFPILYIPGLNDIVFLHTGISWEWGIIFVCTFLFVGGIEAYKWGKRVYYRRTQVDNTKIVDEEMGEISSEADNDFNEKSTADRSQASKGSLNRFSNSKKMDPAPTMSSEVTAVAP